jgi:hypothetical protein
MSNCINHDKVPKLSPLINVFEVEGDDVEDVGVVFLKNRETYSLKF